MYVGGRGYQAKLHNFIYMNNVAEVDLLRSTCLHRAESTAAAPLVDSACASRSGGVQESTGEHSGVNLSHLG